MPSVERRDGSIVGAGRGTEKGPEGSSAAPHVRLQFRPKVTKTNPNGLNVFMSTGINRPRRTTGPFQRRERRGNRDRRRATIAGIRKAQRGRRNLLKEPTERLGASSSRVYLCSKSDNAIQDMPVNHNTGRLDDLMTLSISAFRASFRCRRGSGWN